MANYVWADDERIEWKDIKDKKILDNQDLSLAQACAQNYELNLSELKRIFELFSDGFDITWDNKCHVRLGGGDKSGYLELEKKEVLNASGTVSLGEGTLGNEFVATSFSWDTSEYIGLGWNSVIKNADIVSITYLDYNTSYGVESGGTGGGGSGQDGTFVQTSHNKTSNSVYTYPKDNDGNKLNFDDVPGNIYTLYFHVPGAISLNYSGGEFDYKAYTEGLVKITSDRVYRFRSYQSNSTDQHIITPSQDLRLKAGSVLYFGDVTPAFSAQSLYRWYNQTWDTSLLDASLWKTVEGDETKTDINIGVIPDETLNTMLNGLDDNSTAVSKKIIQSVLQPHTIPKFLIEGNKLYNLPVFILNKTKETDGNYILQNIKINDTYDLDRFGCWPTLYPIYLGVIEGNDRWMVDITTDGYVQLKKFVNSKWETTATMPYDSNLDRVIVYDQCYQEHIVENPITIGYLNTLDSSSKTYPSSRWTKGICFSNQGEIYGRIGNFNSSMDPCIVSLKSYIRYFYEITKTTEYNNQSFSPALSEYESHDSILRSIIYSQSSEKEIELKNVGDQCGGSFDIGNGFKIEKDEDIKRLYYGPKIKIKIEEPFIKGVWNFNNTAETNHKNATDVYCYCNTRGDDDSYGYLSAKLQLNGVLPFRYSNSNFVSCLDFKKGLLEEVKSGLGSDGSIDCVTVNGINTYGCTHFINFYKKNGDMIGAVQFGLYLQKKDTASNYKHHIVLWKNLKLK